MTAVTLWDEDNPRRVDFETRKALMRLRLAEDRAAPHLPPAVRGALALAINGVVDVIRRAEGAK